MGLTAQARLGETVSRAARCASLRSTVEPFLDRIDEAEGEILALLPEPGRRERLLAEADALEAKYPDPASRPPLFGVPLGVKDLFVASGFETRAGSRLPPENFRLHESAAVTALKKAGCLILGKTVTTEFAYFSPGPTRNPWNTAHTPGGSSSGSAAAVAAGFCPLALGTQTIGSISRPAAFCGVAGYKPTWGRTSSMGVVPFSPFLDHIGYFTATGRDLAIPAPVIVRGWESESFLQTRDRFTQRKPAFAVPEGPYLDQAEPAALEAFFRTVETLRASGFRIVKARAMEDIAEINERHRRIAAAELAIVHREWFAAHGSLYSDTTADLIRKGQAIGPQELERDKQGRYALERSLRALLDDSGADFWIAPSAPGPAPEGLGATGSPIMNLPWTHAGVPTVSLPSGFAANGLPLGLQVIGRSGKDEELLALADNLSEMPLS